MLHASPVRRKSGTTQIVVPCPLCDAPVTVSITASAGWIDDVVVEDVPCDHDTHRLVDSLGFHDACCEAARKKWEDR